MMSVCRGWRLYINSTYSGHHSSRKTSQTDVQAKKSFLSYVYGESIIIISILCIQNTTIMIIHVAMQCTVHGIKFFIVFKVLTVPHGAAFSEGFTNQDRNTYNAFLILSLI